MRDFISMFFACLFICCIVIFFFADFFFSSLWGIIIIIALFFAILITGFYKQAIRIENLEKKVEDLLSNKQDIKVHGEEEMH